MKANIHRIYKWIITLSLTGIILLSALYLFRSALIAPYIKRFLEDTIESRLGMDVAIGNIGGTYITDFEVGNVTTLKPATAGTLISLQLRRLRVSYNLLSILQGLNAFIDGAAVELEAARLEFDLSHGDIETPTPPEADSIEPIFLPELLPRIRVDDTSVFLRGANYETTFKGIALETRPRRQTTNTSTIQLHVSEWSWIHPGFEAGKTPISAEIEYSADKIAAKRLMLNGSELAEFVQIGLKALPETMPFQAKLHLAGGQLALDGKLGHSNLFGRINGDHLDLALICSIFQPKPALEGKISMKADITLPLDQPTDLAADLDLQLKRGNIYGLAADDLHLEAAAKDGKMRLDKLDLRTGGNLIKFRDVSSSSHAVFGGDAEGIFQTITGGFSFDCRDVPSFFSLAGVDLSSEIDAVPAHRLLLDGKIGSGDIIISGGSLTMESGHIRLDTSRIALPSISHPIKDTAIQAALDIDLPHLESIGRLFKIPQLGGTVQGHANVTGTLGAPSGTAVIAANAVTFQGVTYGDLMVTANADSHRAVIESMELRQGRDRLTGRGVFDFETKEIEDAQVELRIADLSVYAEKQWPEGWKFFQPKHRLQGSLSGRATISGPLNMPGGTVAINARQIVIDKNQFGDSTLRLHSDGRKITVEKLEIRHSEDRVVLNGSIDVVSADLEDVNLEISIADIADYTKNLLSQVQPLTGAVYGTLMASGNLKEPKCATEVKLKNLQAGGVDIPGAVIRASSAGRRILIEEADAKTPMGQVKLSANILRQPDDENFDVQITALSIDRQGPLLKLDKTGHMLFSRHGDLSLKDISLSGTIGSIHMNGAVAAEGKANIEVTVSNLNSSGWFESLVTDRLDFNGLNANLRFFGPLNSPSLTVTGDLAKLGSSKDRNSLTGHFDISYTKNELVIRHFDWHGQKGQQISVTGKMPIDIMGETVLNPGELSVDAQINLPDLGVLDTYFANYTNTQGALQAEMHLTGTWKAPSGTIVLECRDVRPPSELKPMPPGPFMMDGRIRFAGQNAVIESIQIDSPALIFSGNGEWIGMPALADLLQGSIGKSAGDVAMTGNLSLPDLSWIAEASPTLRRVSGRLQANVTMTGPIADPAIDAVVRLTGGELRPDIAVPSLQAIELEAAVSPTNIRLKTFTGELGGAPFNITGSMTRDGQGGARVDLRIQGENLLFYRSEGFKLRADTDLTVKGAIKRMEVAGEVAITDGRLVKYFDFLSTLKGSAKPKTDTGLQLFSIRTPPFSDMVFDVRLTSRNPFRIHNNLAKGTVRPELKLTGRGELPVLSGNVYVDPTRISLPAGILIFESGIIRFDPNRPDLPTLDLIGKSTLLGYDVTVLLEGPYNEPVVTLSSVPPLSNQELLLLLVAGQLPDKTADADASQRQSMNVAVFLGRDLISRWFGSDSTEAGESIIDRFEVNFGKAVTRSGEETIDAQFRIADRVFFDNDKLYITGEKDIFDFYNAGVKIVFRFK